MRRSCPYEHVCLLVGVIWDQLAVRTQERNSRTVGSDGRQEATAQVALQADRNRKQLSGQEIAEEHANLRRAIGRERQPAAVR
ncbi:MAG: hypothetical protein ACK55I_50605, partial [bacterium]